MDFERKTGTLSQRTLDAKKKTYTHQGYDYSYIHLRVLLTGCTQADLHFIKAPQKVLWKKKENEKLEGRKCDSFQVLFQILSSQLQAHIFSNTLPKLGVLYYKPGARVMLVLQEPRSLLKPWCTQIHLYLTGRFPCFFKCPFN